MAVASAGPYASLHQKGKTNLDFTEARDSKWQWHRLGHMQVCTLLQTDNHANTPPLSFFTGRMPFLPPYQQRQSTDASTDYCNWVQYTNNKCSLPAKKSGNLLKSNIAPTFCSKINGHHVTNSRPSSSKSSSLPL